MQTKKMKRLGAAVLAATLVMSNFGHLSAVQAAETTTQMSSDKEVVYVNTYNGTEREQNFDDNWKFYLGDANGAENKVFDDSRWESVNLPHDYSIEQEYTSAGEGESAYLLGGTGWYRKYFTLAEDAKGKEIRIDFGGVYMNATVWVNGTKLGIHPYGYTPFSFDITDYVNFSGENVISVKVDHKTPSSRWYSGSGIYRSVNLTVTDKVHVDLYGTQISTPNLEKEKGGTVNMNVKTTVANEGTEAKEVVLVHKIVKKGTDQSIGTVTTEAKNIAAGESAQIAATLPANNPSLWDTENPNLYTVITEVKVAGKVVDTYETEYGFRYFKFDKNTGFYLNGEALKLKGVCMHHDQGSLGSEAHYRAIERQVEILQEMGCNSIRVTHNPAAQELIEICNEKGILVIEEFFDGWMYAKNSNTYDYSTAFRKNIEADNQILGAEEEMTWAEFDMKAVIARGENAPSIIMWSLGNEIQEGAGGSGYSAMADKLIAWAQETNTTKLLTIGSNAVKNAVGNANNEHIQIGNKLTAVGGTSGTNYSKGASYDSLHSTYPDWCLYGSETASHTNSRGVYDTTASNSLNADKELTSYDYSSVGWGAPASSAWYDVITRDFVAGEYVWTGFDYLGEPTPANGTGPGWASGVNSPKNSYFGIVDTAGLPKDNYYFYQSQWNDKVTTLHVLPAWNEDVVVKGATVPVVVYSDAKSVKLELVKTDGTVKDLGTKTFVEKTTAAGYTYQITNENSQNHQDLYMTWNVAFEAGTLRATAYDENGKVITNTEGRSFVKTTGDEAKLEASADRTTIDADGKDLTYITVNVTDAEGNIVPDANNNVKFKVEGEGVLVGVDNGKQSDHQSFQDDNRDAYNGSLVAIVQSTKAAGTIKVTATADGLESAVVSVTTKAGEGAVAAKEISSFYMSKNYYVKVGNQPALPQKVEVRYNDGSKEEKAVTWSAIDASDYQKEGTLEISGTVDGSAKVIVVINMIDSLGGLLNYSAATSVGTAPVLPEARPAVAKDGSVLDVSFPVTWEKVNEADYAKAGTFTVAGTANVLGDEMTVTATIRVQNETVSIGDSISNQAAEVTQDIAEDLQSDTLDAIKDGDLSVGANTSGGQNLTMWTNYNNSQAGDNKAELVFRYDTQQRFGQIVIHFVRDSYSAEWPDAGTTEIYFSEDGSTWTKLEATETVGTANGQVKPYTYDFAVASATFVKFCLTNSTANKTAKPCTGISEIELKKAEGTFATYTTATLASVSVAGNELTAEDLAAGKYYTLNTKPAVTAEGAENAAVTVLPLYNGKISIVIESEDHNTREVFTIYTGMEAPVEVEKFNQTVLAENARANSQQLPALGTDGGASWAFDDDNHWWHSRYSSFNQKQDYEIEQDGKPTASTPIWIETGFDKVFYVDHIEYTPRGTMGIFKDYTVSVAKLEDPTATPTDVDYTVVKTGQLENTTETQTIQLDEVIAATHVRITVTSVSCTGDSHVAAKKIDIYGYHTDPSTKPEEKDPVTDVFEDVVEGLWYVEAVQYVYNSGLMSGFQNEFSPNANMSRAMVVTTLYRMEGSPAVTDYSAYLAFKDVKAGDWYADAVAWALNNDIATGDPINQKFNPNANVTREQLAAFLYRYTEFKGGSVTERGDFSDMKNADKVSSWALKEMQWAVGTELISGIVEVKGEQIVARDLAPQGNATRAQMATILQRYCTN